MKRLNRRILVIGAGVSGLTTAWELLDLGFSVSVVAEKQFEETVSMIAGALWEWPPAVCGFHSDIGSLLRSKEWSKTSYDRFLELSDNPDTGVKVVPTYFYFRHPVSDSDFDLGKMNEIKRCAQRFQHDGSMIEANGVNPALGLQDCYRIDAPVIDTHAYLSWMRGNLQRRGVRFINQKLSGPLMEVPDLHESFDAHWVVNCSGLGSRELMNDEMYPLRGALLRMKVHTEGEDLHSAHCITNDASRTENMIYLVPRGDYLMLGGIAQPNQWDTSIDLNNSSHVQGILDRCLEFMPSLRSLELCPHAPVAVGLRPGRKGNVRLDVDVEHRIAHNYGHGGSGFSFSWGCTKEIADTIQLRIAS